MRVRRSIRPRLAVSAICLVLAVVAAIAGVSYRDVRRTAIAGTGDHLASVSRQLADMFGASARQVLAQASGVASDTAVAALIHSSGSPAGAGVARALQPLAGGPDPAKNGVLSVEVWDADGKRLYSSEDVAAMSPDRARDLISRVDAPGDGKVGAVAGSVSPLAPSDSGVAYSVIAAVSGPTGGRPIGFVVQRRLARGTTQAAEALIGPESKLMIGNSRGGVWTDLTRAVAGPPTDARPQNGIIGYRAADGEDLLAAIAPIANTPWSIAVQAPRSAALAPVRAMLWRLGLITLLLLVLAAAGAWFASGSLTRPIERLTTAAEAVRAGDYAQRLPVETGDEIGALAGVFNEMAERVASMLGALGTKVAELENAESRLKRVIASSGAILFEVRIGSAGPTIDWISDNVTRILGYGTAEVLAPDWWSDGVHPADRSRVPGRSDAIPFQDGAIEYRFRHKDGRFRWLREEQRLVDDPRGGAKKVVGAWIDITEQRQLEDRLQQAQKMEAIGRLAGGVAHDFNNLLTVMLAECQLLLADPDMDLDERTESIDEVRKAADRATLLTRQLLSFSRRQLIEPTSLDVNDVITDVQKMLARLIGEDIEVRPLLSPNAMLTVADRGQIEQVVVNLAVNARDAMPYGGTLTIETALVTLDAAYCQTRSDVTPGEYVQLSVSDTGTGMTDDVKAHAFEPFFTTKETGKGTGLGLATCYAIVRQFRGHIAAYSEVNVGTTMKVYLPCASVTPLATAVRPAEPVRRGTETILLVEDDDAVRRLTAKMLASHGYTVLQAATAETALELLLEHGASINLLMTDVVLPRIGGRALAEQVTRMRPNVRVLFASGYSDDVVLQHRLTEHDVVLIQKPFTDAMLSQKVGEALERPARQWSPGPAASVAVLPDAPAREKVS